MQSATTAREWVAILDRYPSLSWEMLPDAALGEADVWSKLVDNGLPQTALMRQLPRLTRLGLLGLLGLLAPMSGTLDVVVRQLTDAGRLLKARVHPVNILVTARTYASGTSAGGLGQRARRRTTAAAVLARRRRLAPATPGLGSLGTRSADPARAGREDSG